MDVSNISNWGSLTASQILAYEEKGADVPDEFLTWAESVGESFTQTYNETASTASTLTSTAAQINEAMQAREELVAAGISLKDLAEIFTNESTYQQEKMEAAEATLQGLAAQSSSLSAEISDAQTSESKTDKISKLATIGSEILKVYDMSVDSKEIGDETIDIATDLNSKVAKNEAKQSALISAGIGGAVGTAIALGAAALGVVSGGLAIAGIALLGAGIGAAINLFSGKGGKGDNGANYNEAKTAYDAGNELNSVAAKAKEEAKTVASANNITIQEAQSAEVTDATSAASSDNTYEEPTILNETNTKKKG